MQLSFEKSLLIIQMEPDAKRLYSMEAERMVNLIAEHIEKHDSYPRLLNLIEVRPRTLYGLGTYFIAGVGSIGGAQSSAFSKFTTGKRETLIPTLLIVTGLTLVYCVAHFLKLTMCKEHFEDEPSIVRRDINEARMRPTLNTIEMGSASKISSKTGSAGV